MQDFPLYASLVLLAIGLVMVVAFFVGVLEGAFDDDDDDDFDPDWDGKEEP